MKTKTKTKVSPRSKQIQFYCIWCNKPMEIKWFTLNFTYSEYNYSCLNCKLAYKIQISSL